MAIDDIIRTLEEEIDEEVGKILAEAHRRADSVEEEARRIAAAEIEKKLADCGLELQAERMGRLTKARNAVRERLTSNREALMDAAFDAAAIKLAELPGKKEYRACLEGLFQEALRGLPEAAACRCRPGDESIVREMAKGLGFKGKIVADKEVDGGVVLESADGRVTCSNSFAKRMEKARTALREEVAGELFSS